MKSSLHGKRALVCGSTQGIGRASAELLAKHGADVTLVARDENALKSTVAELDQTHGQAHGFVCADFANPDDVKASVGDYVRGSGVVHILVNNTGGPASGPIVEATPDQFLSAIRMHVVCNQLLAQCVIPGMKEANYGRIVNIISTSVKAPIPGLGVSNTTRAAVANWAKTLAGELAAFGITVNNVLPGMTATTRLRELIKAKANRAGVTEEEMEAQMKREIPAGRFAEPEEIAAGVAFLASPAAGYITGTNLVIDGGRTQSL